MLDTLGWDLSGYPQITLRERYDHFVPIAVSDTACLVYGGYEPHAFVMVGSLAIFRHQDHPELVLEAPEIECLLNNNAAIRWNESGTILFVAVNIEWKRHRRLAYPLAVIDLVHEQFSFIVGRNLPGHAITEISERRFRLTEKDLGYVRTQHYDPVTFEIDLDMLPWYDFDRINDFHTLYKAEHERRGLLKNDA